LPRSSIGSPFEGLGRQSGIVCQLDERIEKLNPGQPTEPRPAASVILLRSGGKHSSDGLEVLLARRTPAASFMADVWVFPGGALDGLSVAQAADRDYRAAAIRELEEEVSVVLTAPERLVPFSRWITPLEVKVRYDTSFFLAEAPPHSAPEPDGQEIVDVGWFGPKEALERHVQGELLLVFPTIKNLESLAGYGTVDDALAAARGFDVQPILPRIVTDGEPRVLLPGDPGYPLLP
jgi:8-oxo-dGTP pyrophosphatase MutT (NUDIX family)